MNQLFATLEVLLFSVGIASMAALLMLAIERLFRERPRLQRIGTPSATVGFVVLFALLVIGFGGGSVELFFRYVWVYGLFILLVIAPLGLLGLRVRTRRGW